MVNEALRDTRVVTVNGARQVGKSTLIKAVLRSHPNSRERRLDDAMERQAALSDPTRFVRHTGLLAIDEIQRVPELVLSIKAEVDQDSTPGRFILTGSARLLGLRKLPDALVGRMETIEIWPFSQGEIDRRKEQFIDYVFDDLSVFDTINNREIGTETRDGYNERCLRGGFPEAVKRTGARRAKFFDAYADDLIDKDVMQLAEIQRRGELRRLLKLLAGSMAQPLQSGISRCSKKSFSLSDWMVGHRLRRAVPWGCARHCLLTAGWPPTFAASQCHGSDEQIR